MTTGSSSNTGPTHKLVEAGVTLLIALFGVIVIIGSVKAGINWGAEGPRAGFFPFYIGIFIVASSAINLWNGLREDNDELFAEWGQLRQVLSVVIPTAIYVGAMPFTGLYVASIDLHRMVHAMARQIPLADRPGGGVRHAHRHLLHFRALVSGPASEGADRRVARSLTSTHSQDSDYRDGRTRQSCFTALRSRCSRSTSW